MAKPKVLVFLGTSRQGSAVVDALLASDKFEVYATTRSAKSAEALKAKGVNCGPFTCGDAPSAQAAVDACCSLPPGDARDGMIRLCHVVLSRSS